MYKAPRFPIKFTSLYPCRTVLFRASGPPAAQAAVSIHGLKTQTHYVSFNEYLRTPPVTFSHGQGGRITDIHGQDLSRCLSGIAVNTLGHNHPVLVKAIAEQAVACCVSNLWHP